MEMESRGISKYKAIPYTLDVNKPDQIIDLNKYIWLFVSESVDTRPYTRIELKSPNNTLIFSKTVLEQMHNQFRFFDEELEITVDHYGAKERDFIPFRLEFWRIIPIE